MKVEGIILNETTYETPKRGYTLFTDNFVTIIGERVVVIDGDIKEQYIYNIDGYEAENGKPFISLKANIVLM